MIDLSQLVDSRSSKKDVTILCHSLRKSSSSLPHLFSQHCEWAIPIDILISLPFQSQNIIDLRQLIDMRSSKKDVTILRRSLCRPCPRHPVAFRNTMNNNSYWQIDLTIIQELEHDRSKATCRSEILQEGHHHSLPKLEWVFALTASSSFMTHSFLAKPWQTILPSK